MSTTFGVDFRPMQPVGTAPRDGVILVHLEGEATLVPAAWCHWKQRWAVLEVFEEAVQEELEEAHGDGGPLMRCMLHTYKAPDAVLGWLPFPIAVQAEGQP